MDPKGHISVSPFAVFLNNPQLYIDPKGDTLDYGNTYSAAASKMDILSLVNPDNHSHITFDNGRVGIDMAGLSNADFQKLLSEDEGLNLLNDLINSPKKFLYDASDISIYNTGVNYNIYQTAKTPTEHYLLVASDNGRDSKGGFYYKPSPGYNGTVVIHPSAEFYELDVFGARIKKSRASIVFHELAECYERTHLGNDYQSGFFRKGAHEKAQDRELKWWGQSAKPGVVDDGVDCPDCKMGKLRMRIVFEDFLYPLKEK